LSREKSPEQPIKKPSFLERILDARAPTRSTRVARPSSRRDQLALYLEEPPLDYISVIEYWKSRETQWPQLAALAFDFLAIPYKL
jgi:hypothetical protein